MHIYEEIDNLHIISHNIYSEEFLSSFFANSNKTTALINIEIDEKMRFYKT